VQLATTAASTGFVDFLLGHLRIGVRRARLFENEILATGISLKAGLLDPDHAVAHLAEIGALSLCGLSS
jgi:hypothetical protein